MIFRLSLLQALSRRFVSFDDACISGYASIGVCFRHRLLCTLQGMGDSISDSNFLRKFFRGFLELHIFRIDEINTSQHSSTVELRFFKKPTAMFLSPFLTKSLAINDRTLMLLELVVNRLLDHIYPSGGFSLSIVNCVKPVQGSNRSRSPSTCQ